MIVANSYVKQSYDEFAMIRRILLPILACFLLVNDVQTSSITNRGQEAFQLIKETKEKVKHGIQCISPSKYYAGSCYTYMKAEPASSWERAYNNCLTLPSTRDARLLAIESIDEYEFIERELIGLKSGSDSVSVYVGLRKMNSKVHSIVMHDKCSSLDTWFWSNDIPLKETPVYRFWVDNNRDILAYDCGILWLARNTSVITPAPCVEQALRPYVCKQVIDRCYNNTSSCGKYGKCINLPWTNSYKCQCRFLYTGDQCEKWSSQGVQIIIGIVIVFVAFIVSYVINTDRSEESWFFRKTLRQQCPASAQNSMRSSSKFDDKHRWSTSNDSTYRSSCSLTVRKLFIRPKKLLLILFPLTLTIIIVVIIINAKDYVQETLIHSTELFQFCILYDNNYYHNLLTLPLASVIILFIIVNQTRKQSTKGKWSVYVPLPFNPFSKLNRFDTVVLCGIVSHEILEIIEEVFLKTAQMKLLTINGPLFDLVRQFGLIIIVGLRYYPVYSVIEMTNGNTLYYALCALHMWLDLGLRIFEQAFCMNMSPLIRTWQKFEQFKSELTAKYEQNLLMSSTTPSMYLPEYEDARSGGFRRRMQRFRERFSFHGTKTSTSITTTTTVVAAFHPLSTPMPPHSLNWSSINLNLSTSLHSNDSLSTFEQFGLDSSIVGVIKYAPYYLCLTYICCRLTYLLIENLYEFVSCCNNETNSRKKSSKHIYHEPTFSSEENQAVEFRYVRHLFQTPYKHCQPSWIKSLLHKFYCPKKHFQYSKQILNLYMIAFMLIYYLTFNILENGFNLIEKIYSFTLMPLYILYDELDLPEPKLSNLKYEMLFACCLTSLIYFGQLCLGMKHYQRHMLHAYQGIFVDIPSRSAFKNMRLMSKNIHYPGYCIAYLTFGYVIIGNLLFFTLVILRVMCKHLFLVEEIAK
ncbi:unnamed protein product, partial [Adineta ricciae]